MRSKRDMERESKAAEGIDPEIQKQVDAIGERWRRLGIKFDSVYNTDKYEPTDLEKKAEKVRRFSRQIKE